MSHSDTSRNVFVGIDLGSYKTSIVCSNGNRCVFPTAVGWPKDAVAKRMFGTEVVFGDDIMSQQRSLTIVRPFAKAALKFGDQQAAGLSSQQIELHGKAARQIVEYGVKKVGANSASGNLFGAIGAPAQASVHNHKTILNAASGTFTAAVVVHEPFAVGYGVGKLNQTLIVDIGAGTIDICPMFGAYPSARDQLTIPLGGDLIDEAILEAIRERYAHASCSLEMARRFKEKLGTIYASQDEAVVTLNVEGKPCEFEIGQILREACSKFVSPIVSGIWQVVSQLEPEYHRPLLDNVLLAGGGSQLVGLDRHVEAGLRRFGGGNVSRVYDSVYAGAAGALKLAMDTPAEEWNRLRQPRRAAA
ncbi:MAG: rod shape-determining protein [Planctomycetales bacterium]|nr:rod shape-determining protein [Planctomycetales bacterium]